MSWLGWRVETWWWLEQRVRSDQIHAFIYKHRKAAEHRYNAKRRAP